MTLPPEPLRPFIDGARQRIKSAGWPDARLATSNARADLRNVLAFNEPCALTACSMFEIEARFEELRAELEIRGRSQGNGTSVENARERALLAIDRLEEKLADAKPNGQAVALSLAW
jgi:hypothetical protein